MPTPDAVLLDFDGVIVDSEPMHEAGLRAAFARLGMSLTPELNAERLVGFADRDAYREVCILHGRTPSDSEFDRLSSEKWIFAQEAMARGEVPAFEGTLRLIAEIDAAGVPWAICSGARRHEILAVLARLGLTDSPRFIISADDVTRCKPDPEPYATAVARLGFMPGQCITVEDTDKGIASAKAAGVRAVAVGHTLPASRLAQADRFVPNARGLTLALLSEVLSERLA